MYIDTHTKEDMEKSICKYLGIGFKDLLELFKEAPYDGHFLNMDEFNKIINVFLDEHCPKEQINQILFFHLSRRLNESINDVTGYNLEYLLTENSTLKKFLKKHEIEFIKGQEHIKLYYKKKEQYIDFYSNGEYLKRRLGYYNIKDYCFNGFAFKDILYRNTYANLLLEGPEFIINLGEYLEITNLYEDYYQNSKYFCYEYCIPIEKVIFDKNEYMSVQEKQRYLLTQIIVRLYDYNQSSMKDMSDCDNPILRLRDNEILDVSFFRSKEEITKEMLQF